MSKINFLYFFTLTFFCFLIFGELQSKETFQDRLTLTVTGEATISKPADEVHLTLGVVSEDSNAQKALISNNLKMSDLIKNLETAGINPSQYQTGQFTIHPLYSHPPKEPNEDWHQKIVGYEVTNTLEIKLDKIDMVGKIIDSSVQAGANTLQNIQFSLKDPQGYNDESISKATQNAIKNAHALAVATHVQLVRILRLTLEEAPLLRGRFHSPTFFNKTLGSEPTVVEPGNIEISSRVNIIYEISEL
jgi:uncharacterized protein